MGLHNGRVYGTNDELAFINRIGTEGYPSRGRNPRRIILLHKYLNACRMRKNWARLNREIVIAHLEECIRVATR